MYNFSFQKSTTGAPSWLSQWNMQLLISGREFKHHVGHEGYLKVRNNYQQPLCTTPCRPKSTLCCENTKTPLRPFVQKSIKLVTGIIWVDSYKFRKQMKFERKNKYPMRRWKLGFSLQGGPCLHAALPRGAHFHFPHLHSQGYTWKSLRWPQTFKSLEM